MSNADLSIIVPTLNEEKTIGPLLENLLQQKNIRLEVIITDGGSIDHTLKIIDQFLSQHSLNARVITSPSGRGIQMNHGAAATTADELLFLHADCRFDDESVLETALTFLKQGRNHWGHDRIAGHFALRFLRDRTAASLPYYFYEGKTHLNRLDTINGDQGFMLSKHFFQSLGGFDESLGYMEDARLARKIFATGVWITLPGIISTSARRFETEGLKQRQVLNALLCNFEHIGLQEFFSAAANAYRAQDKTRPLDLKPFLQLGHELIAKKGVVRAGSLWYRTGSYVANNAWQAAFAWDCRRNFALGVAPGRGNIPVLEFYDTWLAPIINSPPGRVATTVMVFIWFYCMLFISGLRR